MEREEKIYTVGICLFIVVISILIVVLVAMCNANYEKAFSNPPSQIFVEEDLEDIFLTTQIDVIELDDDGDAVLYTITANGYKYKVLYKLCKTDNIGEYEWRYIRHVQIKE